MPSTESVEMAARVCLILGILGILDIGLAQGRFIRLGEETHFNFFSMYMHFSSKHYTALITHLTMTKLFFEKSVLFVNKVYNKLQDDTQMIHSRCIDSWNCARLLML